MITQVYQFKNLPVQYKNVLNKELNENQTVYVVKDSSGTPKSITTNVLHAIQKTQK
jgi:hypothetical protein